VRESLRNLYFIKWRLVLRLLVRALVLIVGAAFVEWMPYSCDWAFPLYIVAPLLVRFVDSSMSKIEHNSHYPFIPM
jgi:hypothetical protein